MNIEELKKLAMQHTAVTYSTFQDECDSDFVVIAVNKFAKLVKIAEAAQRLIDTTEHTSDGYVHVPPSSAFFSLKEKLQQLETK